LFETFDRPRNEIAIVIVHLDLALAVTARCVHVAFSISVRRQTPFV
jgi:hypothetical protein